MSKVQGPGSNPPFQFLRRVLTPGARKGVLADRVNPNFRRIQTAQTERDLPEDSKLPKESKLPPSPNGTGRSNTRKHGPWSPDARKGPKGWVQADRKNSNYRKNPTCPNLKGPAGRIQTVGRIQTTSKRNVKGRFNTNNHGPGSLGAGSRTRKPPAAFTPGSEKIA